MSDLFIRSIYHVGATNKPDTFPSLHAQTGRVEYVEGLRKNTDLFLCLLERLRRTYRSARKIVLIADNYIIHKSNLAQAWLAHNPKFEILFQPAYQPWVNDIEKLWKQLHDNITRNHRYPTIEKVSDLFIRSIYHVGATNKPDTFPVGPFRLVLVTMFKQQPDGPLLDFRGISFLCFHDSSLSRFGVSGNPGAIQFSEFGDEPFPVGTPVSGFFEYFTVGTDLEPLSEFLAVYQDALTSFSLIFGAYSVNASAGEIRVEHSSPFIDEFNVTTDSAFGLAGPVPSLNGPLIFDDVTAVSAIIVFQDLSAMTLDSKELPTAAEIEAFPLAPVFAYLVFRNESGNNGGFVSADIESVSVSVIPLPPALNRRSKRSIN